MQEPRLIRSAAAFIFVFCTLLISPFATSAGDKPAEIKVAYFQQWPVPVQFAQAKMTFDSMLGMMVNWVPFRSGRDMAKLGKPLLSGVEQQTLGLMMFDVIAVTTEFGEQHPDIVEAFMKVTEVANRQWSVNPDPMLRLFARTAEMDRNSANNALRGFRFPLAVEQKTDAWMGASVSAYSVDIASFSVSRGQLDKSLDSYERFVTTRFLP